MNKRISGLLMAAFVLPTVMAFDAPAANFSYASSSRLWVEGTSSVRSYSCEAGRIDGGVRSGSVQSIGDLQDAVLDVDLAIPVALLDCRNGTMNGHMTKALDASGNPFIRYAHKDHKVSVRADGTAAIAMNGTLTIAGSSRPISLDAIATQEPGGSIRVKGSKELKMTDFGVKPPTLMLGTMKVHDPVTVKFDLLLNP